MRWPRAVWQVRQRSAVTPLPASWQALQLRVAFERLVEAAQVSGRKLRPRVRRGGEAEQERQEEDALHGQPNP